MALLQPQSPLSYDAALKRVIDRGWLVASEGSSGAQLKKPKAMKVVDKWLIGLGVPLILLFGVGFLLVLVGLVDYALFTREQTFFLSRSSPSLPPGP